MAVDYFLKLDGVKGESKDDKHKEEIQVESFSWGLLQTGSHGAGGGGGTGKVNVSDLSVAKKVDKATPTLMLFCANGKHIPSGLLTCRKAGENPVEYLKVKLSDILVSAVQHAGHGELADETVTLNFGKFEIEYQEQGNDGKPAGGPATMGWDVKANKKV